MIEFLKMHGLGNDFLVFDARRHKGSDLADMTLDETAARLVADRRLGVGCDQIMILREPQNGGDVFLDMRNQDGSETGACGNGTRCVASLIMRETGQDNVTIETKAGLLESTQKGKLIEVNMGQAHLGWDDIPLLSVGDDAKGDDEIEGDTNNVSLAPHEDITGVAVNMGNPHIVLFVPDADEVDVAARGAALGASLLFPEGVNVSFAHVMSDDKIRMRVFERGVGITSACGSGACAVAVAAARRGLASRTSEIVLDGGSLFIRWQDDGTVMMAGPVATSYKGVLTDEVAQAVISAQKAS